MKTHFLFLLLSLVFYGCHFDKKKFLIYELWYNKPALHFEETLVLGNGQIGATVFGGIEDDKIFLNHASLWTGEPVDTTINTDAHKYISEIRAALKDEDYQKADDLQRNIQGKFSESYAPLGTLKLHFVHSLPAEKYKRSLLLNNAISKVEYQINGVEYTREYFVSYPHKCLVVKIKSSKKDALSFSINFESQLNYKLFNQDGILKAVGYAPVKSEPNYRGDISNAVVFDKSKGTRFTSLAKIISTDGKITVSDSSIHLKNGSEALLLVSIANSFNGFDRNPATDGLNSETIALEQLDKVSALSYSELKQSHLDDYQSLFSRVSFDLGNNLYQHIPTDERLLRYSKGEVDNYLEALYFQYGRYLLISSSRTPNVPANLQGIWNPYIRPPWSSNYTTNINVEENYWMAETGNLPEMHQSLLGFIGNLAKSGKYSAKNFLGIDNGWMVAHNSDIWAMTNPVGDFGNGDPVWANWYMGSAWLSTHLWEHYLFSQDSVFLSDYAYDIMKGAAQFCLGCLVDDGKGNLVTSPSTSPENKYITPDGYCGATLYGATSDLAMIRACFSHVIEASERLSRDEVFRRQILEAYEQLYPYQIGKDGSLQEWNHDWKDQDPKHRHQSHLFGLYPDNHISPIKTPELAKACKQALEIKGDETTGWSKGWRINLWARLLDGDRAYKMYRELLRYVEPDAIRTNNHGGGTYPNLFDAHPPFQIDGNFGGSAAVIEMLMQSDENVIYLLPALPGAWPHGTIRGIKARGGYEVSINWKDGELQQATITNLCGNSFKVKYRGKEISISSKKGEITVLNKELVI
ncbi:MAG: glycoside hydrolase family 95 protein [Marinilabiliaceae bacterium]|nr:glycoside hydrolase family 95 protein [Marinilabiliaceae bacterium]